MLYPASDYLPENNPLVPFQGREYEINSSSPEYSHYLLALEKESHISDVRWILDEFFGSNEKPEVIFERLSAYIDQLHDFEEEAERKVFMEAFSTAMDLILDDTIDWNAMKLSNYSDEQIPLALQ